jgi:hypothetical protein
MSVSYFPPPKIPPALEQGGINYSFVTLIALGPFGPFSVSKLTESPSARDLNPEPRIEVWWTNTSPPSSLVIKPKPFESLNHFTVPLVIPVTSFCWTKSQRVLGLRKRAANQKVCGPVKSKTSKIRIHIIAYPVLIKQRKQARFSGAAKWLSRVYDALRTITICRPSIFGWDSTLATSPSSRASLFTTTEAPTGSAELLRPSGRKERYEPIGDYRPAAGI